MSKEMLIISLILLSGLAGGIGNFFRSQSNEDFKGFNFLKSLFMGIVASFTVPLFLNMVSSDLLKFENAPTDYFVFVGFCLIAAFFSNRFLNSVGDKVIQDLEKVKRKTAAIEEETKENTEKVGVLVDDQTDGGSDIKTQADVKGLPEGVTPETMSKIFEAFKNEKYKFRTVQGIAKDSGMGDEEMKELIGRLEQKNIVKRYRGRGGKQIYSLTD